MSRLSIAVRVAAVLAGAWWIASVPAARAGDNKEKRQAATNAVRKMLPDLRKAPHKERETVAKVKEARKLMAPFAIQAKKACWTGKSAASYIGFGSVWNELLTVAAYHEVKGPGEYVLTPVPVIWNSIRVGLPVGGRWSVSANDDPDTRSQLHGYIRQTRPDGEDLREIKIWVYKWNTTYSGVGGENYKKLARMMFELDRDSMIKKGRKASPKVVTRKLSKYFPRVYHYFVQGFDVDEGETLRRRNYYMKGNLRSFNFEVIDTIDPVASDDPVTAFQAQGGSPELIALLKSIQPIPKKKK